MLLFILAQTFPLFVELVIQEGIFAALKRLLIQCLTLSPLHFVFQAKIIGNYISNEVRYGGASYVATGRGLPNERKRFIGWQGEVRFRFYRFVVTETRGGSSYAKAEHLVFYDGLDENGEKVVTMPHMPNYESDVGAGITLDFGAPRKVTGYSFRTSCDSEYHDPVRWHLEGSNDAHGTWTIVHTAVFTPTTERQTDLPLFSVMKGAKLGGLYNSYAFHAHHSGILLLINFVLVVLVGGLNVPAKSEGAVGWLCALVSLTVTSWLFAPYIFNPYQFSFPQWWDLRHWKEFFFADGAQQWFSS